MVTWIRLAQKIYRVSMNWIRTIFKGCTRCIRFLHQQGPGMQGFFFFLLNLNLIVIYKRSWQSSIFQVYWLAIDYLVVAKSAIVSTTFFLFVSIFISYIQSNMKNCFRNLLKMCDLQSCGSYFTAVLYVEHWCEEKFKCLSLGSPDFSDLELVSYWLDSWFDCGNNLDC